MRGARPREAGGELHARDMRTVKLLAFQLSRLADDKGMCATR